MSEMDPKHSIPAFFAGRSIFVTGGTGFMGKVLIEKLLWSCPDIQEIFLLIRPKKNVPVDDRLRKMLSLPLFERLRQHRPEAFDKLIPVQGDTCVEGLGLPPIERHVLIERVSIVFHVAASVRFDDPIRHAIFINTRSTRDVCILAANMKKLVALMHVSSTYSQTDKYVVEEQLYPCAIDWKRAIKIAETVDDHTLRILTPKFMGNFPNTYTFTKRLAEAVVADYAGILPIVVFRPSIVISTESEPVTGWLDNFNGPVGMLIGGGKGIIKVSYLKTKASADFIPVDIAIKAMITSTWKRGLVTITQDPSISVYNCSSADIKNISMAEIAHMGIRVSDKMPLENIMWIPGVTITDQKFIYYIMTLLLHVLPAVIVDTGLRLAGKKPMLVKLQRKVYAANSALEYFLTNEWKFKNDKLLKVLTGTSPADSQSFGFDYSNFDINDYFLNCIIGAKIYLLNEDMKNLPEAKAHYNRMYWVDVIFKVLMASFFCWLMVRLVGVHYA